MKLIFGAISILLLGACINEDKSNLLTGDLYFGLIRIGSYYNLADSTIIKFENSIDTINFETADEDDKEFLKIYRSLKDQRLLYKPYVDLLIKKDSTVKLYLDSTDYDQIKIYKRQKLQNDNKKIRIEAKKREIRKGFYYCIDLKKVELINGETLRRQGVIKIEDYN